MEDVSQRHLEIYRDLMWVRSSVDQNLTAVQLFESILNKREEGQDSGGHKSWAFDTLAHPETITEAIKRSNNQHLLETAARTQSARKPNLKREITPVDLVKRVVLAYLAGHHGMTNLMDVTIHIIASQDAARHQA